MKKVIIVALIISAMLIELGCTRGELIGLRDNSIDFQSQGFTKMYTTAYYMGHHTANGSAVHTGGCACSPDHIGDVAIVYTLDGQFLGYYECNDTGTEGVNRGTVLDIYRTNYTQCLMYMKLTKGRVWVKWIEGAG